MVPSAGAARQAVAHQILVACRQALSSHMVSRGWLVAPDRLLQRLRLQAGWLLLLLLTIGLPADATALGLQVPSAYYLLPSAAVIPRTSTGKVQRGRVAEALEAHGIPVTLDTSQVGTSLWTGLDWVRRG